MKYYSYVNLKTNIAKYITVLFCCCLQFLHTFLKLLIPLSTLKKNSAVYPAQD